MNNSTNEISNRFGDNLYKNQFVVYRDANKKPSLFVVQQIAPSHSYQGMRVKRLKVIHASDINNPLAKSLTLLASALKPAPAQMVEDYINQVKELAATLATLQFDDQNFEPRQLLSAA